MFLIFKYSACLSATRCQYFLTRLVESDHLLPSVKGRDICHAQVFSTHHHCPVLPTAGALTEQKGFGTAGVIHPLCLLKGQWCQHKVSAPLTPPSDYHRPR